MFRIESIDHVVLRASDMARMRAFYCDVLGCTVEREQHDLGLLQLRAGAALIDLVDVAGPLGQTGGAAPGRDAHNLDHLCLRIDPFDEAALRAHLARFAIEASSVQARFGAQGLGPSLYLDDPEGNSIELKASVPAGSSGLA